VKFASERILAAAIGSSLIVTFPLAFTIFPARSASLSNSSELSFLSVIAMSLPAPRFEFGGIEHMILERQPKREWIVCTNVHGEGRKRCGQEHYRKTDKWHYYACSFSGCPRPPQTYLL
jgi:hypothetical protein